MKKVYTTLFAVLLFSIFLNSTASADHGKTFEGRKLFATYCYLCHGMSGKGDGPLASTLKTPPADLTDPSRLEKRTDAELFRIIEGTGEHHMAECPKCGKFLPEPKIRALVAYVRYLHRSRHPFLGNPEAGEKIYDHYCSPCHGKKGKGDGLMASSISVKPADHTAAEKMDKKTNEELINIVTNGKGEKSFMPPWKGILSQSEIESVVGYIRFLGH